jgi:hypothetical protein
MQLFVDLEKYLTLANHFVLFQQQAIAMTRVSGLLATNALVCLLLTD